MVAGPTKEVLARYTALTGRPALPPAWSFGLWLTTSFCTPYDERPSRPSSTAWRSGTSAVGVPLRLLLDARVPVVGLPVGPGDLSRPGGHAGPAEGAGPADQHVDQPYIAQKSRSSRRARRSGAWCSAPAATSGSGTCGRPGWRWWTSPARRAGLVPRQAQALLDQGVDCFKTDFGSGSRRTRCGGTAPTPSACTATTRTCTASASSSCWRRSGGGARPSCSPGRPRGRAAVPGALGRDCFASFEAMAESLRARAVAEPVGLRFLEPRLSAASRHAEPDVFKRWLAFGLLSSHSRLHGNMSYRVPWEFGDEAVGVAAVRRAEAPADAVPARGRRRGAPDGVR